MPSEISSNTYVDTSVSSNPLAFLFPGQGSQSLGMLAALSEQYPQVRETFVEASAGAGTDLWALSQGGPEEMLNRTEYTQPALLAAGIAVWRIWQSLNGPAPTFLAGHSLGEYTALVAAGALGLADAAHLVRIRGQAMQAAAPAGVGAMAAVIGADDAMVEAICSEVSGDHVVVPANYNSPGQIVIGGHQVAVDAAIARLGEQGIRKVVKLAVSVPSHTPLMREAANRLAEAMRAYEWREPRIPVVQNVDAGIHASLDDIRDALVRQLYLPVRWTQCMRRMQEEGVTRMAECGPGKVLAGLMRRIDKSVDMQTLGTPAELDGALEAWS
jgi:[acyl-carrier-protein] S-malonyltransferase